MPKPNIKRSNEGSKSIITKMFSVPSMLNKLHNFSDFAFCALLNWFLKMFEEEEEDVDDEKKNHLKIYDAMLSLFSFPHLTSFIGSAGSFILLFFFSISRSLCISFLLFSH